EIEREDLAEAPHAGLARQMEDAVDAVEVERVGGEVEAQDVEAGGVPLLLCRVVVVGEAVDSDDLVAGVRELVRQMRADEPGGAGDEVPHRGRRLARSCERSEKNGRREAGGVRRR